MSAPVDRAEIAPALDWLRERAAERGYQPVEPAGVSLGGCASAHRTTWTGAMRRSAHAHTDPADPQAGWLCFKAYRVDVIVGPSGLPTVLARHEYAHLLAPRDNGHGPAWRRAVTALGSPSEAERAERRSSERRARRANTVYHVAGQPATRDEYLAATRATLARQSERTDR